jgi:hypothetical protein
VIGDFVGCVVFILGLIELRSFWGRDCCVRSELNCATHEVHACASSMHASEGMMPAAAHAPQRPHTCALPCLRSILACACWVELRSTLAVMCILCIASLRITRAILYCFNVCSIRLHVLVLIA